MAGVAQARQADRIRARMGPVSIFLHFVLRAVHVVTTTCLAFTGKGRHFAGVQGIFGDECLVFHRNKNGPAMQRVTLTLDDTLMADLDQIMAARGYASRSEAIRDLARAGLSRAKMDEAPTGECVAAAVYTFPHDAPDAARRVSHAHHHRHDLAVSALHVHLDRDTCLEVSVLRGPVTEVRHFAEHLVAQRQVQNGEVVIIPLQSAKQV